MNQNLVEPYYLRYSIEKNASTTATNAEILHYLQKHFEEVNSTHGELAKNEGKFALTFHFSTVAEFDAIFTRNLSFYETLARIRYEGSFDFAKFFTAIVNKRFSTTEAHTGGARIILKQATNRKRPIKENYRLSFQMADIIDYGACYEEIEDGFLIFYRSLQDFYDIQVDRLNYTSMELWLQSKGLWNGSTQKLLKYLINSQKSHCDGIPNIND